MGQTLAHHLRVPGIVLLLLFGVALGPDGLDIVRPAGLGGGLTLLVELAVAVILFEGGLSLNLGRLRREATTIRSLITIGAIVTGAGGTLAVRLVAGWDWPLAVLFGTLVIVTGPTVITPLLRRIQVKRNLHTILEAEGVLIDPIGAIIAVVALEIVVGGGTGVTAGTFGIVVRLLVGVLAGVLGGITIAGLMKNERLVPEPLQNILALSLALALFEISNAIQPESGLMAVVAAGFVVTNLTTRVHRELLEFKEQLTVLLVGMLFVLLAADVRITEVQVVGLDGLIIIALLMFVVRPLCVGASTVRSSLTLREKAFLSWLSPRGIVAAAVASLFAQSLAEHGMEGGADLRALVFMVIAVTVVVQGLTGAPVASLLGVRKRLDHGYVVVGANALGRALATALQAEDQPVVLIDRNRAEIALAEELGLSVVYGDATEPETLLKAESDTRRAIIAVTSNTAVNVLVARQARETSRLVSSIVTLNQGRFGFQADRIQESGHQVLFGRMLDMDRWIQGLVTGVTTVEEWVFAPQEEVHGADVIWLRDAALLPLALTTGFRPRPVVEHSRARSGDSLITCVSADGRSRAHKRLRDEGWAPAIEDPLPASST